MIFIAYKAIERNKFSQVKFESKFLTSQYIPNREEDFGEEGDPIVV